MLLDKMILKEKITWLKDEEIKNLGLINENVFIETIIGKILVLINYFVVKKLVNTTGGEFLPNYTSEGPKYIVLLTWIVFSIIVAISVMQIVLKCRVYNKSDIEEYEKDFYKIKVFDRFVKVVILVVLYMIMYQIIFQLEMKEIDIKNTILVWVVILNTIIAIYLFISLMKNRIIVDKLNLVLNETIKSLENGNFNEVFSLLNKIKFKYALLNGIEFNIMNRAIYDIISLAKEMEDRESFSNLNKVDLITNISHDLRTPLTSVINYVDFLGKDCLSREEKLKYLDVLERKAKRIKVLIDDLKESLMANSSDIVLDIKEVDLREVLNQTLLEVKDKLLEEQFTINLKQFINSKEVDINDERKIVVRGDYNKILRIYQNLISNIIKYSYKPSEVFIIIEYYENKVNKKSRVIFINEVEKDINIDADKLIERFRRGDISRNTEGTGLGLDIAKGLTEAHGGDLTVEIKDNMFIVNVSL
ncbi:HAMP domain-containing sensor histidine kinase [Clostridium sp. AL.422]|uniref:sensor histidine kinase n=1 Tax=Clostridium TaxID=1485 RepID=UPI00293DF29E|nr:MULTISPECIES: HAMP domain-containing sensor histidine kinase [unclassified Clostridium]MDV4149454.1 HAMP domain-containing sensor histidine kinase [Clostridium sp. AL.422]